MNLPPGVTATEHTDRESWLEDRRQSTGASGAPSLFGEGWSTELQEYARATGAMPPAPPTDFWRLAQDMQPVARIRYVEETGHRTHDWGEFTILRNAEFPHMHCTLDYLITLANGERKAPGVLECKYVVYTTNEWDEGLIPLHIQMQVQQQLAVTGWEWGAVAALQANGKFLYQFVERNEDFIQSLASRVQAFWARVADGDPPEPTADDGEALRLLYPNHVPGKTISLPGEFLEIDERLQANKRTAKGVDDEIKADENLLKAQFGDAETAILPNGGTYSYKRQVRKAGSFKASESRVLRRLKG